MKNETLTEQICLAWAASQTIFFYFSFFISNYIRFGVRILYDLSQSCFYYCSLIRLKIFQTKNAKIKKQYIFDSFSIPKIMSPVHEREGTQKIVYTWLIIVFLAFWPWPKSVMEEILLFFLFLDVFFWDFVSPPQILRIPALGILKLFNDIEDDSLIFFLNLIYPTICVIFTDVYGATKR